MRNLWTAEEALFRLNIANLAGTAPVSVADERQLIQLMLAGKKAAKQLAHRQPLTPTRRKRLEALKEEGAAARRELIQTNGRLVVSIASQYTGRGLSLSELAQEGVLGLIRAIDKFDPAKGVRLSTYATYWIRQSVSRAVSTQGRAIRLPVGKVEHLRKISAVMGRLYQELGRLPDIEEVAAQTGDPPDYIYELLKQGQETVSLDEPIGEDGATLADFIENEDSTPVEDQVASTQLKDEIDRVLATLSPRESRIVELRYGLHTGDPLTLQAIGERFGLTRERIRQIEQEAILKLRQPDAANRLEGFVH
jgi:RNA polymerase nonessential primary-like sigma factor